MADLGAIGYIREPLSFSDRIFFYRGLSLPVVVGEQRSQAYWTGATWSVYRRGTKDSPIDPDGIGFKWYRPGGMRMKWPVAAGARTLKVEVKKAIDSATPPRVRVLANAALGVAETIASVADGVGSYQTITVNVSPTSAGILIFCMEQPHTDPAQIVSWGAVEMT